MSTDGFAADSELFSVGSLLPPPPPDHLLSAPRGEHHPAKPSYSGDSAKGLFVSNQKEK